MTFFFSKTVNFDDCPVFVFVKRATKFWEKKTKQICYQHVWMWFQEGFKTMNYMGSGRHLRSASTRTCFAKLEQPRVQCARYIRANSSLVIVTHKKPFWVVYLLLKLSSDQFFFFLFYDLRDTFRLNLISFSFNSQKLNFINESGIIAYWTSLLTWYDEKTLV